MGASRGSSPAVPGSWTSGPGPTFPCGGGHRRQPWKAHYLVWEELASCQLLPTFDPISVSLRESQTGERCGWCPRGPSPAPVPWMESGSSLVLRENVFQVGTEFLFGDGVLVPLFQKGHWVSPGLGPSHSCLLQGTPMDDSTLTEPVGSQTVSCHSPSEQETTTGEYVSSGPRGMGGP